MSLNEGGYVSRVEIMSGTLWTLGVGFLTAAWLVVPVGGAHWLAGLLSATAMLVCAMAATLQVKTYFCRLSRVITATTHLRDTEFEPGVRALR